MTSTSSSIIARSPADWNRVFLALSKAEKKAEEKFGHSYSEALKAENRCKNRWHNVLPYDKTRITLTNGNTDYINANKIALNDFKAKFIGTQGPLEETVQDFWRMIWQRKCQTIVMLCKTTENKMEKCAKYWPEKEILCQNLAVRQEEEEDEKDFIRRTFELESDSEKRSVTQFHFSNWPDFGVPQSVESFLSLIKAVERNTDNNTEIVVHCSAGIGRTGSFCLAYNVLSAIPQWSQE